MFEEVEFPQYLCDRTEDASLGRNERDAGMKPLFVFVLTVVAAAAAFSALLAVDALATTTTIVAIIIIVRSMREDERSRSRSQRAAPPSPQHPIGRISDGVADRFPQGVPFSRGCVRAEVAVVAAQMTHGSREDIFHFVFRYWYLFLLLFIFIFLLDGLIELPKRLLENRAASELFRRIAHEQSLPPRFPQWTQRAHRLGREGRDVPEVSTDARRGERSGDERRRRTGIVIGIAAGALDGSTSAGGEERANRHGSSS
mmetsp:Transcript_49348/g.148585  ORF Transcript_49348/g.148585 Transcript_49348/m.148585 type:complete len:257 (-) Transcript_49348:91-861(-)